MATRKTAFANGEFYHVYNRGVDKRVIYSDQEDISRFFQSMVSFNSVEPIGSLYELSFSSSPKLGGPTAKFRGADRKVKKKLVNVTAYCLNPNHFHFILEQVNEGGISEFMKRLSGGYTWYFNNRNKRTGSLFQGKFKAIHIDSNEYLLHLSAYVNLNDRVHQLGGPTAKLVGSVSSWREYGDSNDKNTKNPQQEICEKDIILEQFRNHGEYKKFALSSLSSIRKRKEELKGIEKMLLE